MSHTEQRLRRDRGAFSLSGLRLAQGIGAGEFITPAATTVMAVS